MGNEITKATSEAKLSVRGKQGSVLEEVIKALPADQRQLLAGKAYEALMERELSREDAQLRHDTSTAAMVQHVGLVNAHEKNSSDFTISSEFNTASGKTTAKVTKSNNMTIMVIAVVVAVIFFSLFAK
jgi:hypothetical protein